VRRLWVLFILFLMTSAVVSWWFHVEMTTPYYGSAAREIFVEVPRGAGTGAIARMLADAGIVHHRLPFVAYLRWIGAAKRLKAGEYRFHSPATPGQIAERLIRGDTYVLSVTLPEGLTAFETAEMIADAGLGKLPELLEDVSRADLIRDLDPKARTLEGYLFPETYRFSRKSKSEEILKAMTDQFRLRFERLVAEVPLPPSWTCPGIVTLASMIEKEVRTGSERPLVASVLVNRLRVGMPLACDPTIIYALKLTGKYNGNLRKADLGLESPYNSYLHPGLPPGPICNPGEASLRAALSPASSDYLYYVSRNDGTHQFSKDYRTHQTWVLKYQKMGMRGRN
jgi:UPF0755 protein